MSRLSKIVQSMGPYSLYPLARLACRKAPRILMYHRFSDRSQQGFTSAEAFEAQIAYIKRHYQPMTLRDLTQSLFETGQIPLHAVVVTVDDGYRDFYRVAWPILKRHKVPATLFATTGFIDGRLWLWPDKITWLLDNIQAIHGRGISCGPVFLEGGPVDSQCREQAWRSLIDFLLSVSDEEKHRYIDALADELNLELPEQAPQAYEACSWGELVEMEREGLEVGGHTVTHPSLGRVTEEQAGIELQECFEALKQHLGEDKRSFCFPNGTPGDFNLRLMKRVEMTGFVNSVVAFHDREGTNHRYALRRHGCGENMFQFQKAVSGLEWLGDCLRARSLTSGRTGEAERPLEAQS